MKKFQNLNLEKIQYLLECRKELAQELRAYATEIKKMNVKNIVYYRGLIEYSNVCTKNCFYCGIRSSNSKVLRYTMSDEEVFDACDFAWKSGYGSIVLQAGEINHEAYIRKIEYLLKEIKSRTNYELAITLSLGEQTKSTFIRWKIAGADRYLLRIETSNKDLYKLIHPENLHHLFDRRIQCLRDLKELGFQVGSGVMIGLPFQTIEDIAHDLLFLKEFELDMVGMGPYLEHIDTPLYTYREQLRSKEERLELGLNAVAILRILAPEINIAATTALQSIHPQGRENAILSGANIIMPNITPKKWRENYKLYENKPCLDEDRQKCAGCLETKIRFTGNEIGVGEKGDSVHFLKRNSSLSK